MAQRLTVIQNQRFIAAAVAKNDVQITAKIEESNFQLNLGGRYRRFYVVKFREKGTDISQKIVFIGEATMNKLRIWIRLVFDEKEICVLIKIKDKTNEDWRK